MTALSCSGTQGRTNSSPRRSAAPRPLCKAGRSALSAAATGRRGATTRRRTSPAQHSSTTRTLAWLFPPRRTEATT
eukprot:scaffold42684_cov54-Phaeocystis_antarctica.AAC.1